jgi:hypothetical protein
LVITIRVVLLVVIVVVVVWPLIVVFAVPVGPRTFAVSVTIMITLQMSLVPSVSLVSVGTVRVAMDADSVSIAVSIAFTLAVVTSVSWALGISLAVSLLIFGRLAGAVLGSAFFVVSVVSTGGDSGRVVMIVHLMVPTSILLFIASGTRRVVPRRLLPIPAVSRRGLPAHGIRPRIRAVSVISVVVVHVSPGSRVSPVLISAVGFLPVFAFERRRTRGAVLP